MKKLTLHIDMANLTESKVREKLLSLKSERKEYYFKLKDIDEKIASLEGALKAFPLFNGDNTQGRTRRLTNPQDIKKRLNAARDALRELKGVQNYNRIVEKMKEMDNLDKNISASAIYALLKREINKGNLKDIEFKGNGSFSLIGLDIF